MTNGDRKALQDLMTNIGWPVLEKCLNEYIDGIGLNGSIKRITEFETIWQRAFAEGGEQHLKDFFQSVENEARKYI